MPASRKVGDQVEIVGDANDATACPRLRVGELVTTLASKLHRPGLACHMRVRPDYADQPLVGRVDPSIQRLIEDELYGFLGVAGSSVRLSITERSGWTNTAAVEASNRGPQGERPINIAMPRGGLPLVTNRKKRYQLRRAPSRRPPHAVSTWPQ